MNRFFQREPRPPAQAPGTVQFHGERKTSEVTVNLIDYDATRLDEKMISDLEGISSCRSTDTVSWIHINGLHDTDLLREFGEKFGLHSLVLEDIVNTHQRPKVEDFGEFFYFVCRMLSVDPEDNHLISEQFSLVVGPGYILTFQEKPGNVLEPVRERLRRSSGRIRTLGAGYLFYALVDAVVDHYFSVLEVFGDQIEISEVELLGQPGLEALQTIHHLKREVAFLRRAVWPLRDAISSIRREGLDLLDETVSPFLGDVHDHLMQVSDEADGFRDQLSGLQDLYLSSVSNRMNEVMKVLTIFASIFVPLTFVAGVYGMNFEHMPELAWRWSYPIFWGIITVLIVGMLIFFRRRKWL